MYTTEHRKSWIGRTISHYRLLEEIGRGGMGVVYKAQDLLLERFVALKFLLDGHRDEIRRQRFLQEARAASLLDHPNICTIFEAEQDGEGNLFIAMRLCEGETLRARIAREPVALDDALAWTSQIAAGLAHAHTHGLIHRDIKPANLILTAAGQIKIVDFGIALQPDGPRLTREGAVVGTVAYMSPEQLQGYPVDHRTDLWSLGIVLYELLTGRLPFGYAAAPSYPVSVLSKNPEPITKLRSDLPAGIEPLFARLLAKDPDHRHQHASELIRDLEGLRQAPQKTESWLPTVSTVNPAPVQAKIPRPPVNPRIAQVSVGRQEELGALAKHLLPEPADGASARVCAIQGMAGVGKTFLADRFAVESSGSFAGGYLRIVLDPKSPAAPEHLLGELADRLDVVGGDDELTHQVRARLFYPRTLLHIENVDSPAAEVSAARPPLHLPGPAAMLPGRLQDLGRSLGWHPIPLAPFDEGTALRQLWGELGWQPAMPEENAHRELVQILGYLPLALHLAAGHLRSGRSAPGFLRALRQRRLALTPADRSELAVGVFEETRRVLATSFSLSLELFREETGPEADRLLAGLYALGHAPLTGFGRSLGAAIAGLQDDDFEELVFHAQKLGILLPVSREERPDGAWRLHSLFGEFLGSGIDPSTVMERMTDWFLFRFPESLGQGTDQGRRWLDIHLESAALVYWVPRLPVVDRPRLQRVSTYYAARNGPFHLWIEFCESTLRELKDPTLRRDFLWTLSLVAVKQGFLKRALQAAEEKLAIDSRLGDEHEIAVSLGLIGDALQAGGSFDEAMKIWQEQQIPILERRGETRERAIALCKVANLLRLRECFEDALRILREEALPAFEEVEDVRSRAVALGFIANILQAQGNLDSALRIRQTEELPIYEKVGEPRSIAVTLGKIAKIHHLQGEHEKALEILQKQIPTLEALGDMRELALCLGRISDSLQGLGRLEEAIQIRQIEQMPILQRLGSPYDLIFAQESLALLYLERQEPGDREEAGQLLHHALESADRLRLPAGERIRSLIAQHGF